MFQRRAQIIASSAVTATEPDFKTAVLADAPDLFVRLDSPTPADLSEHSRSVTAYGTPTTTTDPDYGTVRASGAWITSATLGQSAFTLEAVAKRSGGTGHLGLVGSWASNSGAMVCTKDGTATDVVAINPAVVAGLTATVGSVWRHIAWVWDGTTRTLYLDGVAAASSAWSAAPGVPTRDGLNGRIEIATYQANAGTLQWPGLIHSACSYSTALSSERVAAHAAAILTP